MTNKDIVNFFNVKHTIGNKKLPVRLAFALKLNYEKLKPYADAYNEQIAEIKKKFTNEYGELEENEKNREEFSKELEELVSTEVFSDIHKADISLLEKCDLEQFDSLSLNEFEAIGLMIE